MKKHFKRFATETQRTQRLLLLVSYFLSLASCFLLLFSCAKKMLPPSPDRFAPGLLEITPINRIRLDLVFNEEINTTQLSKESFVITSSQGEILNVRMFSPGRVANTISLFTEPIKRETYFLSGTFQDKSGNIGKVEKRKFIGSSIVDTFAPKITQITPNLGAIVKLRKVIIDFNFSEPMDTASNINFIVTPLDKNQFKWNWAYDGQGITLGSSETLSANTTVYFILQPTLKDLEDNRLELAGYTFFSNDSFQAPLLVSVNLYYQDKPFKNGIVLFRHNNTKILTITERSGNFSARLDSALYKVTALADTNYDNFVDLFAEINNYNSQDTTKLKINLKPIVEGQEIDKYLR